MEGNNSIKSNQLGLLIFITQTGVGIIMIPSVLAKEVGHDGWISVLITGLGVILFTILINCLLLRYKDKAIYDINKFIYGKYLGLFLNGLIIIYLLATTVSEATLFNYFIRLTLLQETPSWALAPIIILPSFYLVWQGLKPMSRFLFCSVIGYFIILFFAIALYKNFRFSFILPIGEAGIDKILISTQTCFMAFIGFETTAFFYPYIINKEKAMKCSIGANVMSTLFFLAFVLVATIIFGDELLSKLVIPFFSLSRIYNAPILERVDLYLTSLWFIPLACSMRTYIFAAYDGLQKVFKVKKNRVSYYLFFIFVLIASCLPRNFNQVITIIGIVNNIGIGVAVFLVLCLVLSFIRKKGVGTN